VGVPRLNCTELLARALMMLARRRAWVVQARTASTSSPTTGYTKVSECRGGAVNTFYLHPSDVGLPKAQAGALQGGERGRKRGGSSSLSWTACAGRRANVVLLNAERGAVHRRCGGVGRRRHSESVARD